MPPAANAIWRWLLVCISIASASTSCCSVRLRSVMSRTMADAPTATPFRPSTGVTTTDTWTGVPSRRMRTPS